jgi:hypothetical protein
VVSLEGEDGESVCSAINNFTSKGILMPLDGNALNNFLQQPMMHFKGASTKVICRRRFRGHWLTASNPINSR